MLGMGLVGVVLPLLPSTPFFLAAAWLFSRSSPRLDRWLQQLPGIGESLRTWRRHRAIGTRAKTLAITAMLLGAVLIVQLSGLPMTVVGSVLAIMLAVATFILTRPTPPDEP